MHSSYISSIASLRCKSSLSFSVSDYTYYIDDRFDRNPISPSPQSCCSCCTNPVNRIPINPRFLYGLRQSTLIQWSPSRRLMPLSYSRFTICDIDPNCYYRKSYSFEDRSASGRRERWRKGNYRCMVAEERGKNVNSNVNDAELMLSLLTEEVSEECLGVRERNCRSSRTELIKKREKRTKKSNVERTSKCDYQSLKIRSNEEDNRKKEEERRKQEREVENIRVRKEGSSCSSYYSFSSLGETESDSEVQVKDDGILGESTCEYKRNKKGNEEIRYNGEFEEEINEKQGIQLEKKDSATNRVECDWRKKSEKKLTEVSIEQAESKKELSQKVFSSSEINKNYDAQKRERKSSSALHIDEGRREKFSEIGDDVNGKSESKMKYNQVREREQIQSSVNKASSSSEKQYRGREDYKSGKYITRRNEYEGNTKVGDHVTEQLESKMKYNQVREREQIQSSVNKASTSSEQQYRGREDYRGGEYIAKVSEIQETETTDNAEEHVELGQRVTRKMNSRQRLTEIRGTHDVDIESTIISKRRSDTRIKKQDEASSSSYQEAREQLTKTDAKAIRRLGSKKKSHDIISDAGNVTKSGCMIKASSEEKGQTSSPHLQLEIHGGSKSDGTQVEPSSFISHGDALASADKSQKFATHFVSEFVEKARNEISTSEVQKITSETKIVDDENKQTGQPRSGDSQPKDRDSGRSSRSSGAKGPSDEMWAVNNPSLTTEEPPETEAEGSTKEVIKKSGRFIWGMMSDIVRLRWGPRTETRSLRSGERSSPNQSTSSDAWFSGHEHDEYASDNVKKERIRVSQSADQQQEEAGQSQSQRETSSESDFLSKGKLSSSTEETSVEHLGRNFGTEISRPNIPLPSIRMRRAPVVEKIPGSTSDASGSSILVETKGAGQSQSQSQREMSSESEFLSKDKSSSSTEETYAEHLEGNLVNEESRPTIPLPAVQMRRSPVIEEILGGTSDASGSGTLVETKEVLGTESKDVEVKRRKLQRNKQVAKDRFDEWEEAFTIEMEQRKMDEMFMKEALEEAKKAGDMWEVPVGAVLVQHGKIIARGYNLVEELRDSTAHAEMICIREGSNVLQSWRLSETTLYVTLEPCPMCAGAILQARVETVVWGAPNKLLGADGSWIRLFPNGGEEGNSISESRDKASAPVHPFHPKMKVRRGVLASECANVMQEFFQLRRRKKEKKTEPPTPPSRTPISNYPSKFFTKMHHAFNVMFCL